MSVNGSLLEYMAAGFLLYYRLRVNARGSPGSRRTLKLNMYYRRRIQQRTGYRTLPLAFTAGYIRIGKSSFILTRRCTGLISID